MFSLVGLMMMMTPAAEPRPLPTAMWSLSGQELRSRIVGKQIRTTDEPPPGLDYVTTERFLKDGRYFEFFHGKEALGTYRFVGEMICVSLDGREVCRTGFTDTNGDLWLLSKDKDRTRMKRHAIAEIPE